MSREAVKERIQCVNLGVTSDYVATGARGWLGHWKESWPTSRLSIGVMDTCHSCWALPVEVADEDSVAYTVLAPRRRSVLGFGLALTQLKEPSCHHFRVLDPRLPLRIGVVIHTLSLEQRNLHGHFSRDLTPVLTIDPGDSVRFSVPNSGWLVESGEKFAPRDPAIDTGHALLGPIAVRGARAGQTLAVRVDAVRPGSWGITKTQPPHFIRWEIHGDRAISLGRTVRLAPFLGVLGMPPPESGIHSTIPPRRFGGNIDCKDLIAGTTLFLPIPVDGALFSTGDGHAAQGDGEVSGTAIESPVEGQLTLTVRDDLRLEWPIARTANAWFTFGFDEDLRAAARIALDGMLALMGREHGLARDDALALASVVVDMRVTQLANKTLGVHAVLTDDAFA